MADEMPPFGPERNALIARLLGWKSQIIALSCMGPHKYSQPPGYCGDNGACFELLLLMPLVQIERNRTYCDEWFSAYVMFGYGTGMSKLPDAESALRDAITQAAVLALRAKEETSS